MKIRTFILLGLLAGILIVLRLTSVTTTFAEPSVVFLVDSDSDEGDAHVGDCMCRTNSNLGLCTLRAAIQEANACTGSQTIRFAGAYHITPASPLPTLTDNGTVIDASNQWHLHNGTMFLGPGVYVPGVVLDGNNGAFDGFSLTASSCVIKGLQIQNFGHYGIYIHGNANGNQIGWTGEHDKNVISLNKWNGILIKGDNATGNVVENNYIGVNPAGFNDDTLWDGIADWGNGWHGVSIWDGTLNVVRNNRIGGNNWSGIAIDHAGNTTVSLNEIGQSGDGKVFGNGAYGIHIGNGARDATIMFNLIANNRRGIFLTGGSSDVNIARNHIWSNDATSLTTNIGGGILAQGADTRGSIDNNDIRNNKARFGGGVAVTDGAMANINRNTIRANHAVAGGVQQMGGGGGIYLHNTLDMANQIIYIYANQILGNAFDNGGTADPQGFGAGIFLDEVPEVLVWANDIISNTVSSERGGGGGIAVQGAGSVEIVGNQIRENVSEVSMQRSGAGIALKFVSNTAPTIISENWLSQNRATSGGAIYMYRSSPASIYNNVIARNWTNGIYLEAPASPSASAYQITNNTIAYNHSNGLFLNDNAIQLVNTIVAFNRIYGVYMSGSSSVQPDATVIWHNGNGETNQAFTYRHVNPLFINAGQDMYGLRPESPCLNTANSSRAPTHSYNGLRRPQGAGADIGAFEMGLQFLPQTLH